MQTYNQAGRIHFSSADAQHIAKLHCSGRTLEQISAVLGIHRHIIVCELRAHDIVLTLHWKTPKKVPVAEAVHLHQSSKTLKQIGEMLGISRHAITRRLRAHGIFLKLWD